MEIEFSAPNCGYKLVVNRYISEAKPRKVDDRLFISIAENVTLHGNYEVRLRLTKDEIAHLARIALGSE